jgi:hypothetical protein
MRAAENERRAPLQATGPTESANGNSVIPSGTEELRLRVQQRSVREQLERNHFLLGRLHAASTRLVQTLEQGDVFEAVAEIIANLIGSEEIAIFNYLAAIDTFSLAWSWGLETSVLQPFESGAGMFGRAVHQGISQFQERQPDGVLLPHEKNLTACIVLKSSSGVVGVIAIFGLLPQKNCLEWSDYEMLKFLETYAAVAIHFQRLQGKQIAP